MEYLLTGILVVLILCYFKFIEIASRMKSIDHNLLVEHQISDSRFNTTNEHLSEMHEAVVAMENTLELIQNNTENIK